MPDISPISIEITDNGGGYKSIKALSWKDVPSFAILTGRNGSGKTQLLEILSYRLTGTRPPSGEMPLNLVVEGTTYSADEVGYVPSSGRFTGGGAASIAQMQNMRQQFYSQIENQHSYQSDPYQMTKIRRAQRLLNGRDWRTLLQNGQASLDEEELLALLSDVDVAASLATLFVAHRLKIVESLERETPGKGPDGQAIGPAPWDVVNEALAVAGFPYRVISPIETRILDTYFLRLRDTVSGNEINPNDLSSGEKVLLQLTLWLFSSSKEGVFPKLLLLDEPDAHLHPSMTVQFLDVISEVLVRKHGVRVIMTTHSPSTVALAPDNAIFQLERGQPYVKLVTDRAEIISVLTAGLITVSPATRFCFVEDEDDVNFYNGVLDVLTDTGPSKDPRAIRAAPSLVFIAASIGKGATKISGGESVVRKWIEKLDAEPLTSTFLGVLDRDVGTTPSKRLKVLGRYSFENYLLDPVLVFAVLLENGNAPIIDGLSVSSGDEHTLRGLSSEQLQAICDTITLKIEAANTSLLTEPKVVVTYTRGQVVSVPNWIVNHRGHSLLPIVQQQWGGHQAINPSRLIKVFRRVRLVPVELATLFDDLQG